jgi:ribonuclease HII
MGYSVPEHFEALDRLGPTIHHRRSFSPVAIALGELGLGNLGVDADDVIADVLPL